MIIKTKQKDNVKIARAVLVGLIDEETTESEALSSLSELDRLLDTAGGETVGVVVQNRRSPDPKTLIGSGKAAELSVLCHTQDADTVVFDCELSPSQIRNLEDIIGTARVIDRSMLILDIFALHATTAEGKLQVELAQLKYTAPRLMGKGTEMSRLGGGIGTRGPGESKLEHDRRHIKRRVDALEAQLEGLERTRKTIRASRDRSGIPKLAIVGYTNAGKSTLLNYLTGAGILAEDKLFATLDATTRKFTLTDGSEILLTDTVGFIKKLPHHLIEAFKSTLDEAVCADILIVLSDLSDPECASQLEVTKSLLSELGAGDKPTLYVFNKCDREAKEFPTLPEGTQNAVFISALTGQGTELLISKIEAMIAEGKKRTVFVIPNGEQGAVSLLYEGATVESVDYGAECVTVVALADEKIRGILKKYIENE